MPRGLVRCGGAWIESDITPAMLWRADGSPYSLHRVGNPAFVNVWHCIVHVGRPGSNDVSLTITPRSLLTYIVRVEEHAIVCAIRISDGVLVDYNPRNIVLPLLDIPQPPTWVICGNANSGLSLRHIDIFSHIKAGGDYIKPCCEYVIHVYRDRYGAKHHCGTVWFVVCGREDTFNYECRSYNLTHMERAIAARDGTMRDWGFGLDMQLSHEYVYIIYTVDGSAEDITCVPNGSNLFLHLLNDDDAAVYLSNRHN